MYYQHAHNWLQAFWYETLIHKTLFIMFQKSLNKTITTTTSYNG